MILSELEIDPDDFANRTGWHIRPEGACCGDSCVPLPAAARNPDGTLSGAVVAERLGMPIVHDPGHGVWAIGPASVTGHALSTATAPELTLPDLQGDPFTLATLRGQKVLLVAWASW